jgi:hypothetical protein
MGGGAAHVRDEDIAVGQHRLEHLGFGQIVVSKTEVPNMLVNLVSWYIT